MNYYEILELPSHQVNQDTIHRKYQELKQFYLSPEFKEISGFTEEELKALLEVLDEAYTVLGNATLKSLYDEKLASKKSNIKNTEITNQKAQKSLVSDHSNQPALGEQTSRRLEAHGITKLHLQYQEDPQMEQWIRTCDTWSGEALRKVREYKGVELGRLSEFTKINAFYIDAIERMAPEDLPAEVFVRGYLKQIVKALELPESVVSSYLKLYQKACGISARTARKN